MSSGGFRDAVRGTDTPLIIGVAGDSGSGKTTFTKLIRVILGPSAVATITLDDYHRYDRNERSDLDITPLHPDANRFDRLASDIAALKRGEVIQKPVYNHTTGTFDPEIPFTPRSIIILEGLHPLFTEEIRAMIDLSIFVDPDTDVKYAWKIRRDIGERGHNREALLEEIARREPDYRQYVAFQRVYADLVIKIQESICCRNRDPPVYRVSLLHNLPFECLPSVSFTLDLLRILPIIDGPFSIGVEEVLLDDRRLSSLSLDGCLPYGFARSLEESIEEQTTVCALPFFPGTRVNATNVIALLIAWQVICRRCNRDINSV
ncbi:MAG: phosphoribulokinase [Methanocalculus sp.]|uniref:phosphoribulokinase n=1 Tax=Methanocalculus sp. TaxID=2004547 RepID=UPI002720DF39|nr:phosphoribulokinase [Methanocalculus sp.]MDO9539070.1 phosphoribulokinase [Methanocalculus sp.]